MSERFFPDSMPPPLADTTTLPWWEAAAEQSLPFVIAVVSLEEAGGVRMISNLVDVDPDEVRVGLPVELVWEDMSEDLAIPRFRPARR